MRRWCIPCIARFTILTSPDTPQGSPNTYLHEPILAYLKARGVTIHLNTRIQDLLYDVDSNGAPTRLNGFITSGAFLVLCCVAVCGK